MKNDMHRLDIGKAFIENLEYERTVRGWTQAEMAKKLELSVSGYRKMISGQTGSIALYTAYKAACIFGIPILTLCGSRDYKDEVVQKLYNAPNNVLQRVEYYLDYTKKLSDYQIKQSHEENGLRELDVITLQGFMHDGMWMASRSICKKLVPNRYGDRMIQGVKVTENTFLPMYAKGEVLVVEEAPARCGDVVILIHLKTMRIYLRKLVYNKEYEMHPINGRGEIIKITKDNREEWFDYGHVIGCVHEEELVDIPLSE